MIKRSRLVSIFLALAMLLSSVSSIVLAQDSTPQPDYQPAQPGEPWQDPETSLWMRSNDASIPAVDGLLSTGGPDDYGYTWDDSVALSWIDATNGTNAGLNYNTSVTGLIPLPFAFKFYENTYTSLYITAFGYVAFSLPDRWRTQFQIPSSSSPNNLIAPNAAPINLATSGSTINQVYYKSGGVAPNRYFTVEWYQVDGLNEDIFTFEVVLNENGDILFQYQQMAYNGSSHSCNSVGIEDSTGIDGLAYIGFCGPLPSNKAIRFYRPAPAAHFKVSPLTQGAFTRVGQTDEFKFTVKNIGELGEDTFDLSASSGWPVSEFYTESDELLTDTDGDGAIDTGSLAEGCGTTVKIFIYTPKIENIGDNNSVLVTVSSALDSAKRKTIRFQTAIPAPFVQVYEDPDNGGMSLDLIQPTSEVVKIVTGSGLIGSNVSVAEMPTGFAYVWDITYVSDSHHISGDIEYALFSKNGALLGTINKLTNNKSSSLYTSDGGPVVTVTPDGHIGIVWTRSLIDFSTYQSQNNVFFAILDSSGNVIIAPTNLTNNTTWGTYSGLTFDAPRITATQNNHFTIAWQQSHTESGGSVDDIYYTVKDSNGNTIKEIIKFTNDTPGYSNSYYQPNLTTLSDDRVMMVWTGYENLLRAKFAVFDNNGNELIAPTNLSWPGEQLDVVQLSTGQILIAGQIAYYDQNSKIIYAILNGDDFSQISSSVTLENSSTISGDAYVSVTADQDGHGILTWMDSDYALRQNLYYGLVNNDGNILTQPMIVKSGVTTNSSIRTSLEGYGNTSYTLVTPTSSDVDLHLMVPAYSIGKSGSNVSIAPSIQNFGLSLAGSVTLTATLDPSLIFVGSSLIPASVVGNTITWNLPDLDFQGEGKITLELTLPNAARGTSYPIDWTLTSTGTEANPDDNTGLTQVIIGEGLYLPFVRR